MDLKGATHTLEDAIITLSGPALAVSGILAGVDLLTGGHFMQNMAWLTLAWAITLMLTLDFQVLTLGVRAKRIYLSDKATKRKAGEIVLACLIAAGIAFVSVQMQSIIARSNGIGISVEQATVQLGINPLWLVWERSALVLFLIFLAGWFREVEQPVSLPVSPSISDEVVTTILAKLQKVDALEQAIAEHGVTVSQVQELVLAIPERTSVSQPGDIIQGFIYKLVDPRNEKPFYVGQTTGHLSARLSGHINTPVNATKREIIDALTQEGLSPRIEALETVYLDADLDGREQYWIDTLLEQGCALTNIYPPPSDYYDGLEGHKKRRVETAMEQTELQAQIGALLLETPDLSSRDVAERLQRPHSTVYRHMKRLEQQKQSA